MKQVNNIKIRQWADGIYHLYHKSQKATCIKETPSLKEAIQYAKAYKNGEAKSTQDTGKA